MQMSNFNVSFIIPAYNEEKTILRCINSIVNTIERSRKMSNFYKIDRMIEKFEIIVVDNMSTDKTADVLKPFVEKGLCKVISCEIKGVTHARQAGYKEAKYDIQAYIDADSWIPCKWFDNFINFVDLDTVCLTGPVSYPDSSFSFNLSSKFFYFLGRLFRLFNWSMLQGGNFVVRKHALDKIGGHSVNVDFYGEDTDLAKRLSKYGKVEFLPSMWIYSSSRRYKNQGILNTTYIYMMNFFWIHIFNKPFTKTYKDYR